jgi:hypothetical protein
MRLSRIVGGMCLLLLVSPEVFAQESFSLVVTVPDRESKQRRTDAKTMLTGPALDPLTGASATNGRMTLIALEDARFTRRDARAVRQSEFLVSLADRASSIGVAIGGGVRSEGPDVNVLLTRVVAESSSFGGRLTGNVLLERPLARDRDGIDLITTIGWSRRMTQSLNIGFETLAEDIEGLWDPNEADGGARLFMGPSVDVASPANTWTIHVTAGAGLQATSSERSSDSLRPLSHSGFVMRISTTRRF